MITEDLQIAKDKDFSSPSLGSLFRYQSLKNFPQNDCPYLTGEYFQMMQYWPQFLSFQLEDLFFKGLQFLSLILADLYTLPSSLFITKSLEAKQKKVKTFPFFTLIASIHCFALLSD